jgi:hypothetical protein
MQRAKAFFVVCAGMFVFALAYHLGATSATAQAPSNPIVGFAGSVACTENGDVYGVTGVDPSYGHWTRVGNIFSGGPTPASRTLNGGLK